MVIENNKKKKKKNIEKIIKIQRERGCMSFWNETSNKNNNNRSLAFGHRQQNVSEGTRINVIFVKLGQEMLGIHLVLLIDNNYP